MFVPGLVALVSGVALIGYAVFAVSRSRKRRTGPPGDGHGSTDHAAPVVARLPKSLAPPAAGGAAGAPVGGPGPPVALGATVEDRGSAPAMAMAGRRQATAPAAAPVRDRGDVLPTLAAGVTLPCDLTPLVDVTPRPEATERVAFITTSCPGETVQRELEASFAAEGGHITWYDGDIGVVRRNGIEANVVIHFTPQSAFVAKAAAFPTAPEGSIVVDLWVE